MEQLNLFDKNDGINPKHEQQERSKSKSFTILHRKNFGLKRTHIEKLLDSRCDRDCGEGAKWVHNGFMNATGLDAEVLDVLNSVEIYSIYAAIWKLKYNRDSHLRNNTSQNIRPFGNPLALTNQTSSKLGQKYSNLWIDDQIISSMYFPDLVSMLIEKGNIFLSSHWDLSKLNDKKTNPYERMNPSIADRVSILREAHADRFRDMLFERCKFPKRRIDGQWDDGDFIPQRIFRRKTESGGWERSRKGWDDKRRYAEIVLSHMEQLDRVYFPWTEEVELK